MDLTPQETAELQKQIKERKRRHSKDSITKEAPLKYTAPSARRTSTTAYVKKWKKEQPADTDDEKLCEINKQIESVSSLPRSSRYAQHRLKVLQTTKNLLEAGTSRTTEQQQELERLLSSLAL